VVINAAELGFPGRGALIGTQSWLSDVQVWAATAASACDC
jgi:hypothetical protein